MDIQEELKKVDAELKQEQEIYNVKLTKVHKDHNVKIQTLLDRRVELETLLL